MKYAFIKYNNTFARYFLSYFLILTVTFTGFFIAVNYELKHVYSDQISDESEAKLQNLSNIISSYFNEINQSHLLIQKNTNLLLSRYTNDDYVQLQATNDLRTHIAGNFFLDDILYLNYAKNSSISINHLVRHLDDTFNIYLGGSYRELPFKEWQSSSGRRLIYWPVENAQPLLLYIPELASDNYGLVYIINLHEFRNLLQTVVSSHISSVAIIDDNGNWVVSTSQQAYTDYMGEITQRPTGMSKLGEDTDLFLMPLTYDHFKIAAVINKQPFNFVDYAMKYAYGILLLVGLIGFILILLSMRLTYSPLRKLVLKLSGNEESSPQEYIKQISDVFESNRLVNQKLQNKISNYRMVMQKTILDSIVKDNENSSTKDLAQIDQFFDLDSGDLIYVVRMSMSDIVHSQSVKAYVESVLPDNSSCLIIDSSEAILVLLIHYKGTESDKDEVLKMLFSDFCTNTNCMAAISNGSDNPMDISALYEKAILTSTFWDTQSTVSYNEVYQNISDEAIVSYPYRKIECLAHTLDLLDFEQAKQTVFELLTMIKTVVESNFYIRSILMDILTLMVNQMNKAGIPFETFSDDYFSTLYYCRNLNHLSENESDIDSRIYHLLDIFETEISNKTIHISLVKKFVEENYLSPMFSITMLADHFNVSIAYMSYYFKKKMNQNLSDYVWSLRLEKAKQLLEDDTIPIADISTAVGYLNSSSFRRKFKQTMKITPSQYRQTYSK